MRTLRNDQTQHGKLLSTVIASCIAHISRVTCQLHTYQELPANCTHIKGYLPIAHISRVTCQLHKYQGLPANCTHIKSYLPIAHTLRVTCQSHTYHRLPAKIHFQERKEKVLAGNLLCYLEEQLNMCTF